MSDSHGIYRVYTIAIGAAKQRYSPALHLKVVGCQPAPDAEIQAGFTSHGHSMVASAGTRSEPSPQATPEAGLRAPAPAGGRGDGGTHERDPVLQWQFA